MSAFLHSSGMNPDRALLRSARHIASGIFDKAVQPGDSVVDATLGTGQDCLRLAQLVGAGGRVYGFDVQEEALRRTRERLQQHGVAERAQLFLTSHAHMADHVPPDIRLAAFNLGWLPGSDKQVTTRADSTLMALNSALSLLAPFGVLVVCIYPGHPEGEREQAAILDWAAGLSPRDCTVLWHQFVNGGAGAPSCLVVEKIR